MTIDPQLQKFYTPQLRLQILAQNEEKWRERCSQLMQKLHPPSLNGDVVAIQNAALYCPLVECARRQGEALQREVEEASAFFQKLGLLSPQDASVWKTASCRIETACQTLQRSVLDRQRIACPLEPTLLTGVVEKLPAQLGGRDGYDDCRYQGICLEMAGRCLGSNEKIEECAQNGDLLTETKSPGGTIFHKKKK